MNSCIRTLILLSYDAVVVNLSWVLSISLLININDYELLKIVPFLTFIFLSSFGIFKLYNRVWAYASISELVAIGQAVTIGSIGVAILLLTLKTVIPLKVTFALWAFTFLFIGGGRLALRIVIERRKVNGNSPHGRALIIGAGDAGVMVARELKSHNGDMFPVGFIDDDLAKKKTSVFGVPVLGNREEIPTIVKDHNVDLIIIAMPSVGNGVIREIVQICQETDAKLRILPGIYQIIENKVSINYLRPVKLEDLLRREAVQLADEAITKYLGGKTVLITGAGGSIGSELCRQLASVGPGKLVLLGHGENSIHKIWFELSQSFPSVCIEIEIADVRDKARINDIFQKHRPHVVFHAAAHKHVPLMEMSPYEAIKTNIFGTRNVAEAASQAETSIFVLISTDKAVNPTSVMGITKRIAELVIQQVGRVSDTIFTAVRFGNVLGSNGSVVPVFQQQIARGGPITVTHPEMERYFMTIPEAVQLVIQAGSMATGGEIFILDMGNPVKIVDMARDMIKLSGLEPEKDVEIVFTGIRPGEKLYEELFTAEEGSCATKHKRILAARPDLVEVETFESILVSLYQKGVKCTAEDLFSALSSVMPEFGRYRRGQVG